MKPLSLELTKFGKQRPAGTPEDDELEILTSLLEAYERKHYPVDFPDPIEAIKVRMEDLGLQQKDLVPIVGSRSHVSEILSRKRKLTVDMIRGLSVKLGLTTDLLVQPYSLEKSQNRKNSGRSDSVVSDEFRGQIT